jgi:hypothetical protein
MADDAPFLPGLSPIAGKPVHVIFDAGRLTSDGGVLVLAEVERRLGIAARLARCLEDPRGAGAGPARVCRDDPLPRLVDRGRTRPISGSSRAAIRIDQAISPISASTIIALPSGQSPHHVPPLRSPAGCARLSRRDSPVASGHMMVAMVGIRLRLN